MLGHTLRLFQHSSHGLCPSAPAVFRKPSLAGGWLPTPGCLSICRGCRSWRPSSVLHWTPETRSQGHSEGHSHSSTSF